MPTPLSASLLEQTLTALPGWQGDPEKIWREVHLTGEPAQKFLEHLEEATTSMGHPAEVEHVPGGMVITLRTPEIDGVSELDISLASHLSDTAHRIDASEEGVDAVADPSQATFVSGTAQSES